MQRLPVLGTLKSALRTSWQHAQDFLPLAWLPILISTILSATHDSFGIPDGEGFQPIDLLELAEIVPFVMFSVAWHRVTLINRSAVLKVPGLSWGNRESRFLWYGFVAWLPAILWAVSLSAIASLLQSSGWVSAFVGSWLPIAMIAGMIVGLFYTARLMLVLPAVAIDRSTSFTWALDRSAGNAWRLTILLFVPTAILAGLASWIGPHLMSLSLYGTDHVNLVLNSFVDTVASFVWVAVDISILCVAFNWFSTEDSLCDARES